MEKQNLERLIGVIDSKLAAIPDAGYTDHDAWRRRQRALDDALRAVVDDEKGTANTQADAATLKLAGIRTSATGGSLALLRNWQNAARRRINQIAAGAA